MKSFLKAIFDLILVALWVAILAGEWLDALSAYFPHITVVIAGYLTWEHVLERDSLRTFLGKRFKRNPKMTFVIVFFAGGLLATFYLWGAIQLTNKLNSMHVAENKTTQAPDRRNQAQSDSQDEQAPSGNAARPNPAPPYVELRETDRQFPLVVQVNLYPWRKIRIENKGRAPIEDVSLAFANFTLDMAAFDEKRVVIQSSSFPMYGGGGILLKKSLKPGDHVEEDIKRYLVWGHNSFEESLKNPNLPRSEYGARVTFRDHQTGQKYACYKVFSSIDGDPEPWGDMTSTTGPQDKVAWIMDLPKQIIGAMKAQSSDGAIDFECER